MGDVELVNLAVEEKVIWLLRHKKSCPRHPSCAEQFSIILCSRNHEHGVSIEAIIPARRRIAKLVLLYWVGA
jgi:hypothetical protein